MRTAKTFRAFFGGLADRAIVFIVAAAVVIGLGATAGAETLISLPLLDIDSGLTSPQGNYRWLDVANQAYGAGYQGSYDYTQASVTVDFYTQANTLHGTLSASDLKPNFAYQLKLVGQSEGDPGGNERIGLTGRWWQEQWNGSAWASGQNLNNKGTGSSPNPNDLTYWARRDLLDPTSPTGKEYRYTAYLVFDYFITDENGDALFAFEADDSYHVLWKTSQRLPTIDDGPVRSRAFSVPLSHPAYDAAYPATTVDIFGEWERLPPGEVTLSAGPYTADFLLTEESFHGGGLAGGWAAAMGAEGTFTLVPEPATWILLALGGLVRMRSAIRRRRR